MIHKIAKIKQLPDLQPDKEWLTLSKAQLLTDIYQKQQRQTADVLTLGQRTELISLKITRRLIPSTLKVVALGVVLLVGFSTTFIAQAAIPGDILYPVKISIERAELALATDPVSEAEISLKHANNRLQELETISGKNIDSAVKDQAISEIVRRLEKNIVAADSSLKVARSGSVDANRLNKTVGLARNLSSRADSTAKTLERQAKNIAGVIIVDGRVIASNQKIYPLVTVNNFSGVNPKQEAKRGDDKPVLVASQEFVTAISEAIKVHEGISTSALNTVLEIKDKDNQSISSADVTGLITDKVTSQEEKLAEVKKVIAQIDTAEVRKLIRSDDVTNLPLADVNGITEKIKKIEADLAKTRELLTAGKEDEALELFNGSKQALEQITDVLSKIDQIEPTDDSSATSTPAVIPAVKGKPVTIETVELATSSEDWQK